MILIEENNFMERFYNEPKPICLYGTSGVIHYYVAYIEILRVKGILPQYLVNTEKEIVEIDNLAVRGGVINKEKFWGEILTGKQFYILVTSSAERFRKREIQEIQNHLGKSDSVLYTDFPFEIHRLEIPSLRTYEQRNKWFYDMQYSGIKLYDMDPYAYIEGVYNHNGLMIKNGAYYMADYKSAYVSIKNGIRKSTCVLESPKNHVYILGSCITYGDRVDDEHTITSYLQWKLNVHNIKYECVNYGLIIAPINNSLLQLRNINLINGDIVILIDFPRIFVPQKEQYNKDIAFINCLSELNSYCEMRNCLFYYLEVPLNIDNIKQPSNFEKIIKNQMFDTILKNKAYITDLKKANCTYNIPSMNIRPKRAGFAFEDIVAVQTKVVRSICATKKITYISLTDWFQRPHEFMEIYGDKGHLSVMGYAYIATIIFDVVFSKLDTNKENEWKSIQSIFLDQLEKNSLSTELRDYLEKLDDIAHDKPDNAGIIVMNSNPFSIGHRYLIEQALKKCPYLYVLVVQEDKSFFKFEDRMEMVKLGTKDLENISIIPSGKFVISTLTFPEYFTKEEKPDLFFDASDDINIFGKYIAKALKCSKRFVGDEPFDSVTNSYNKQMLKKLPELGVELEIFPRKENDNGAISATKGREYLRTSNFELARTIFPESTIIYIQEHKLLDGRENNA